VTVGILSAGGLVGPGGVELIDVVDQGVEVLSQPRGFGGESREIDFQGTAGDLEITV